MIYRVGDEGATVVTPQGRVVTRLRPGLIVIPGVRSEDDQAVHDALVEYQTKPIVGYETKPIRPDTPHG